MIMDTTFCKPELRDGEYVCSVCGFGEGQGEKQTFVRRCRPAVAPTERQAFPSLPRQAANLVTALVEAAADGCKRATPEVRAERLAICEACEHHKDGRCVKCGCHSKAKVQARAWTCPEGKW